MVSASSDVGSGDWACDGVTAVLWVHVLAGPVSLCDTCLSLCVPGVVTWIIPMIVVCLP